MMLGWADFCLFLRFFFFFPKQMNSLIAGVSDVSRIFLSSINSGSNGIESRGMQRWKESRGDVSDCDYKVSPRPCRAAAGRQRVRRAFSQAASRRLAALKAAPQLSLCSPHSSPCFPRSPHSSRCLPFSFSYSSHSHSFYCFTILCFTSLHLFLKFFLLRQ